MGNLILDSLEIRGFRCFKHLQIERLGRVNLIVGKNNVGKTSLLEALVFYARRAAVSTIMEILEAREESVLAAEILSSLKYLFYGRKDVAPGLEPILIGPINSSDSTLSFAIGWSVLHFDEQGGQHIKPLQPEEHYAANSLLPRLEVQMGNYTVHYLDSSVVRA